MYDKESTGSIDCMAASGYYCYLNIMLKVCGKPIELLEGKPPKGRSDSLASTFYAFGDYSSSFFCISKT